MTLTGVPPTAEQRVISDLYAGPRHSAQAHKEARMDGASRLEATTLHPLCAAAGLTLTRVGPITGVMLTPLG